MARKREGEPHDAETERRGEIEIHGKRQTDRERGRAERRNRETE